MGVTAWIFCYLKDKANYITDSDKPLPMHNNYKFLAYCDWN